MLRGHRLERLGRRSNAQLRLRQFQWLDLCLLLQQRVDVRHTDHGILVVEPQPFILHAICQPFVKRLHACIYRPRWRFLAFARACVSVAQRDVKEETGA